MTIDELDQKIYRAVLRSLKENDPKWRRILLRDIAVMRAKLKEMKEGVREEAAV